MSLTNSFKTMQNGLLSRVELAGEKFGKEYFRYFLSLEKWQNDKKFVTSFKNTQEDLENDQIISKRTS